MALLFAATSCAGGGGPSGEERAVLLADSENITDETVTEAYDFLRSDLAIISNSESAALQEAERQLLVECYQWHGVTWEPPILLQVANEPPQGAVESLSFMVAPTEGLEIAQNLRWQSENAQEMNDVPTGWPDPPPNFDKIHLGDPPQELTVTYAEGYEVSVPISGCIAEARSELFGMAIEDYERVRVFLVDSVELVPPVLADPGVAGAVRVWSSCMAESGFEVDTPMELPVLLVNGADMAEAADSADVDRGLVERVESEVVSAHAACTEESAVDKFSAVAVLREGQLLLADREAANSALSEANQHALEVATDLLGE